MARRKDDIADVLLLLPWWVTLTLAGVTYLALTYWLPTVTFNSPFFTMLAKAGAHTAPIVALVLMAAAAFSALRRWERKRLLEAQRGLETIRALDWKGFERLIGEAFRRMGYAVLETGGGGADGGIDLRLRKGAEIFLVQCKQWRAYKVSVKTIRELYGVMAAEGAAGGFVVTSGVFTEDARRFAAGRNIELIDGERLQRLIESVQQPRAAAPKREPTIPAPEPSTRVLSEKPQAVLCPVCNSSMVARTVKQGPTAGKRFWGCSRFPACRGVRPWR